MRVYIDTDSGTVLSGPIVVLEGITQADVEIMCESDETARQWARNHPNAREIV